MKKLLLSILIIVSYQLAYAGNNDKINVQDSLKKIENTNDVKVKIATYFNISSYYNYYKGDSGIFYLKKAEKLALSSNSYEWLTLVYHFLSNVSFAVLSNFPAGLYYAFEELKVANICVNKNLETAFIPKLLVVDYANSSIASSYALLGNKIKAMEYFNKIGSFRYGAEKCDELLKGNGININIRRLTPAGAAQFLVIVDENDKALEFNNLARKINDSLNFEAKWSQPYVVYADILRSKKQYQKAIDAFKDALPLALKDNYFKDILEIYYGIANNFYLMNKYDSSIYYASKAVALSSNVTFAEGLLKTNQLLFKLYIIKDNRDSALKYLIKTDLLKDQIFNNTKANDAINMALNEEAKEKALAEEKAKQQKILFITGICAILLAIGIYLNGKRKQRERLRKIEEDRKNSELKAARDLQQSMLPKENPKRADLDIATFIRSSTEVGGDYYDFFPQADGSIFSVCGDATGHGVTSGMMVSVTKAGLNGINPVKPHKILQRLNGVVKRIDLGTLRMSLNIAEITQDEINLSSAAMPPIYLYKASTKSIEEFMNNGLPLGGFKDEEYVLETRSFESVDILVQLSDGLPEAPNSKGEMYDYEKLKNLILSTVHLPSKEIIDVLMKSVDEWMEGQHNPDDITLVVTKKI